MHLPQQAFLRDAMRRLDLTRDGLAERIGARRRAIDAWLLPDESSERRAMPEMARRFIGEILARQPAALAAPAGPALSALPHLLSVAQLEREAVERLFALADLLQPVARRRKICRVLEGAVLANLFFEASTRTRVSFAAAFARLGGSVCDTTGFTFSSMAKGESLQDTARVIAGYADAIVLRHPEQGAVAEFAAAIEIPVINGGDGPGEHPSQALLDLYTIQREFAQQGKRIDGACVALLGDLRYGRTVHSLVRLLALYRGLHFVLLAPPGLELPEELTQMLAARGHGVSLAQQPDALLARADLLYCTRLQRERHGGEVNEGGPPQGLVVDRNFVARWARPEVVLMHPLPRDTRPGAEDLSTDLDGDPRLAIFRQTDNGIPVRMALFAELLGVASQVQPALRDAAWRRPVRLGPHDRPLGAEL